MLPDEFINETENSRIVTPAQGKQGAVEEPDYDVSFLRAGKEHILETVPGGGIYRAPRCCLTSRISTRTAIL